MPVNSAISRDLNACIACFLATFAQPRIPTLKMNKLRVGILGCANVARKHAIHAFKSLEMAELTGIGSRDKDKAKAWAQEFSILVSGNYDEIINNKEIDAVYIALPTGLHEEWAIKAANANKHILCEKSVSNSLESVKRIVD